MMTVPLKTGATLPQPDWPGIETERLILRQWRAGDVAANMAMLGDPDGARFITADRKPVTDTMAGWRNAAIMAGIGCCTVSACSWSRRRQRGKFVGRVGPFYPPVWPGFEVGWGTAAEFRGKGYAVEAARASIDWSFATFDLDEIVHCIDPENTASQAVARRLGAVNEGGAMLLSHAVDLWVTHRSAWQG